MKHLSYTSPPADAWRLLSQRLTDARKRRMEAVARKRTRHVRLVVQDVHQPHNVSACLRSADAFGLDLVDIVTLKQSFKPSTVARGVEGWLSITRHVSVKDCAFQLRRDGFRLVAGLPRQDARPLYDLPVEEKLAVVFGNEHEGIADEWLAHIDYPFTIPTVGMVESLNISVSAAITLAHLTRAARAALPAERYFLDAVAQEELLGRWICAQIPTWNAELTRLRGADFPHSP